VQSLQSSYFLVFYLWGMLIIEIIWPNAKCFVYNDFDDATNLFLKQVYSCAVVDVCLICTDLPVRWDKLNQSTHFKGKQHKLPINGYIRYVEQ
jgi:hypothetical protein